MILQIKLKVSIQKKKIDFGKIVCLAFANSLRIQLNPVVSFPDQNG